MRLTNILRFSNYIQLTNGRLVYRPLVLTNNNKSKDNENENNKDKETNENKSKNKEKNDVVWDKEGFPWE